MRKKSKTKTKWREAIDRGVKIEMKFTTIKNASEMLFFLCFWKLLDGNENEGEYKQTNKQMKKKTCYICVFHSIFLFTLSTTLEWNFELNIHGVIFAFATDSCTRVQHFHEWKSQLFPKCLLSILFEWWFWCRLRIEPQTISKCAPHNHHHQQQQQKYT